MILTKIGVIGAGTMGNGIAQACAVKGIDVTMVDVAQPAVDKGLATVAKSLDRLVSKGTLAQPERDSAIGRIRGSTRCSGPRPSSRPTPRRSRSRSSPRSRSAPTGSSACTSSIRCR